MTTDVTRPGTAGPPATTTGSVEVLDVTRRYRMGERTVEALRGVSFTIDDGAFVSIVGPSGSGKSTLLHLLGALDRPTSGTVRLFGDDITTLTDTQLAELRNARLGFVFQQFQLLARTSAVDNVALPLQYRRMPADERRERALQALARVGLADRPGHHPTQLSGGEQQRVAIARALVTEPALILADEPTGNLDTTTGAQIMDLLTELNADRGVGLVVITHDPEVAAAAPRSIRIRDGLVEHDGPRT